MKEDGADEALLEAGLSSQAVSETWKLDPHIVFAAKKKTEEQMQGLQEQHARQLKTLARKEVQKYYQRMNTIIDNFIEVDGLQCSTAPEEDQFTKLDQWRMRLSNTANVVLLLMKVWVAVATGSLAIIVSALDSVLDLVSGIILTYTHWSMRRRDKYRYPIGKERLEPLGIVVFACIMGTLGSSIMLEGVRQLVSRERSHITDIPTLAGVMGAVTLVKLALYVFCRTSVNESIQAFAADHFFDVVTNSVGLAGALVGALWAFWVDPLSAILLALWVMYFWGKLAYETVVSLVGVSAPPEYLQKLTYICWNHHPAIKKIDTVRAYTFGKSFFVEVDIVLPRDSLLQEAHDIGEALQNKLESLPEVERCFVHCDYEYSHAPEHRC